MIKNANALTTHTFLSVNVLSTTALIGDTILHPLLKTGPPFLCDHPRHAKVLPFAAQRHYLHLSVIKSLSIGLAPEIEPATSRSAVKRSTD